ncbi:HlyD family type I secretion periplasmic adaptor subunit [Limoniibacter endophyticus]|uniref:Membrane fusion protein (MFP) family protein n=2 Tax=Limoniibacter endophyticus TaxID=1565040 RepID=A0A8J3GH86_9HYPH|nr:hypothetical protein GCM10010136_15760 [Limoniibacter endophyticus]
MAELREVDMRVAELRERRIAALDQLQRMDIRSPRDGVVHQLATHTIGGVVSPGEPIMMIVPEDETLIVEARIQPVDIDQVAIGQPANLRFSAFSQKTTPEIEGAVSHVSADLSKNPQTGESWYTAHIQIEPDQVDRLGNVPLISGMPVEAFVKTGDRTPMSYLLKPLSDQLARSMREP